MTRIPRLRFSAGLVAVLVAALAVGTGAGAQSAEADLSAEKLEMIRTRCSSSQLALQQIGKRDAVSRINRGRAYDQMLRQVSAFNSRFAYNKISAPDLLQLTTELQAGVDRFRINYDHYDTDLSDAVKVDCKQKPADYYNFIVKARADRGAVGAQVRAIEQLMKQYREMVSAYKDGVQ